MEEKTSENVNETYTDPITGKFIKGNPGGGRPKDTEQDKIVKRATKELIEEYKEALGESLTLIRPVLIEKALNGDVSAIKEIHDRVMDKARQPTDMKLSGDLTINVVSYGNNNSPQV